MAFKPKIILCEDELIISLDLKRILKKFGYNVSAVFKSAEEVMSYIKTDRPDLVIADVNLKGSMNGIELADILVKKHSIKVIFLTGSPLTKFDNKLKDLNCDFIIKPFDEDTLRIKISSCFPEFQSN